MLDFEKINEIDKPLTSLTKNEKKSTSYSNQEWKDITTNPTEMKRIVGEYYQQLNANKLNGQISRGTEMIKTKEGTK